MMLTSIFIATCAAILALAVFRQMWSKKISKERALEGISGITLFIELIKFTQQHRGMHSGLLNGKHEFEQKLPALESSINTLYSSLLNFEKHNEYPRTLSIHYPLKKWQSLVERNTITSAQSFQLHSTIIARQLDALWDMSDEFSLTSNNHDDIRTSSQQLVKILPELAEALGQIRALSVQVAAKNEMGADKKLQLLFTLGKIEEHHKNLSTPLSQSTDQRLTTFIQDIKKSVNNGNLCQHNPDALFKEATFVIDEVFVFILKGFHNLESSIKNVRTIF